ncbi:Protein of unknown function [Gryllus bimaculatus]|nr:Protein of unknown function [Gryllus bimaculatus]
MAEVCKFLSTFPSAVTHKVKL